MSKSDDQHTSEETEQRLKAILKGAFAGAPTPLKAVPTRHGRKRTQRKSSRAKPQVEKPMGESRRRG